MNDQQPDQLPEQTEPAKQRGIEVPPNIIKWVLYAAFMTVLTIPFGLRMTQWEWLSIALILGHFSAQLNKAK